jgi:hypothetical protein
MYWKPENFPVHFHSDLLRRYYGGQGSWEWCYKPFIRAGDWGISDKYSVGYRNYTVESVAKHRDNIRRRLAPAAFQQVAPMWYLNVAWTEWTIWENHFRGIEYVKELNAGLQDWMAQKGYENIDQFRGKLALKQSDKASMLMRTQFMNYFADIK